MSQGNPKRPPAPPARIVQGGQGRPVPSSNAQDPLSQPIHANLTGRQPSLGPRSSLSKRIPVGLVGFAVVVVLFIGILLGLVVRGPGGGQDSVGENETRVRKSQPKKSPDGPAPPAPPVGKPPSSKPPASKNPPAAPQAPAVRAGNAITQADRDAIAGWIDENVGDPNVQIISIDGPRRSGENRIFLVKYRGRNVFGALAVEILALAVRPDLEATSNWGWPTDFAVRAFAQLDDWDGQNTRRRSGWQLEIEEHAKRADDAMNNKKMKPPQQPLKPGRRQP